MSQFVVGILFLLIAYASSQEQMTCYRNNGCSHSSSDSTNNASCPTLQGKPGKRGASGLKGEMGFKGSKGDKGDPDSSLATQINDLTRQIEELSRNFTTKINTLKQSLNKCASNPCQNGATCNNEINNYNCDCASGYTGRNCDIDINECVSNPCQNGATCNDELNSYSCDCVFGYTGMNCDVALPINPIVSNGYYYWVTASTQNWQNSRNECQSLGGDLASVGVKTANERRNLKVNLLINYSVWLGGNDLQVEGNFRWFDGTSVSDNEWHTGEPNGGTNQNCLRLYENNNDLFDGPCNHNQKAICSKNLSL